MQNNEEAATQEIKTMERMQKSNAQTILRPTEVVEHSHDETGTSLGEWLKNCA